uniref:Uncharacterized protein n=1 Tax=viral metagenome TaxID=1070528 RepID=A0A6M3LUB1_9ZZZZ
MKEQEDKIDVKHIRQMAIEMSIGTNYHPVTFWNGKEKETVVAVRK